AQRISAKPLMQQNQVVQRGAELIYHGFALRAVEPRSQCCIGLPLNSALNEFSLEFIEFRVHSRPSEGTRSFAFPRLALFAPGPIQNLEQQDQQHWRDSPEDVLAQMGLAPAHFRNLEPHA